MHSRTSALKDLLRLVEQVDGGELPPWVDEACTGHPDSGVRAGALTLVAANTYLSTARNEIARVFALQDRADMEFAVSGIDEELVPLRWHWLVNKMFALDRLEDRPDQVNRAVREAYAFARDNDFGPGIRSGKTNLGLRAADVGRPVEALLHFVDVFGLMPPSRLHHGYAHRGIGRLLAGAGQHQAAIAQLKLSDECLAGEGAAPQSRLLGLTDMGLAAVDATDLDHARRLVNQLDRLAAQTPESDHTSRAAPRLVEARLLAAAGCAIEALELIEQNRALIYAGVTIWLWTPIQVEIEALLVAGFAESARQLAEADLDLLPVQLGHHHQLLAECYAALGEYGAAIDHQRKAHAHRATYAFDPGVFLGIGRTRLAEREAQVADLVEALERDGDLLRRRDDLLSHIVHEVRNPLTVMIAGLDLWGRPRADGSKIDERAVLDSLIERIKGSTEALSGQVDFAQGRYLATSRGVALDELVGEVVAIFAAAAKAKGSRIVWDQAEPLDVAVPDAQLRLAFSNVLSNAVKFSPPGTTIEVRCHLAALTGTSGTARVDVLDQGPGFTAEDHEHAFEPHTPLSARPTAGEPSTGVGLALVKTAIEACGGQVSLADRPGGGAIVSLALPISIPTVLQ